MHSSAREVWREWGRTIAFADVTARPALAADVGLVALTMGLPVVRLATGRARPLDLALIALRWLLLLGLRGSYAHRGLPFWLSPLADPVTCVRIATSAARQPRAWRGRRYGPT
jgi:dolichol-phosphate mannosyltransferase